MSEAREQLGDFAPDGTQAFADGRTSAPDHEGGHEVVNEDLQARVPHAEPADDDAGSNPSKDARDEGDGAGGSLIERVAGHFSLNSYLDRPVAVPRGRPARAALRVVPATAQDGQEPPFTDVGSRVAQGRGADPVDANVHGAQPAPAPAPIDAPRFPDVHHAVDREHLRDQGLIVPEGAVTALLEEFRIVKRQLLVNSADLRRKKAGGAAQRVLVTSPHPGEGKTYCSLNLGLAFAAETESEVLLVDADFAKPSVLSALGLPGGKGLMDAIMDPGADVIDFVVGTDIPGLWVLPAGDATSHDSEYLAASRTAQVLDRLTEHAPHRIVIFDSSPVLAASTAPEMAKYVGQTVVVVKADSTGQGALEDAVSLLSPCPNVELLLNGAQFSPSGRRFGTYYGYTG